MAIVNRDLDASEQKYEVHQTLGLVGTGKTLTLFVAPDACSIEGIRTTAVGLSGSPTLQFAITRFVVGAGASSEIRGFTLLTPLAVGTSGVNSAVLASSGATVLTMAAGDYLAVATGAANTAATYSVTVVVKALQDIKSHFGL